MIELSDIKVGDVVWCSDRPKQGFWKVVGIEPHWGGRRRHYEWHFAVCVKVGLMNGTKQFGKTKQKFLSHNCVKLENYIAFQRGILDTVEKNLG